MMLKRKPFKEVFGAFLYNDTKHFLMSIKRARVPGDTRWKSKRPRAYFCAALFCHRRTFSLWNFVLCLFKISYIKSKVTQDHSETINLFSMWNKANDATYTHKFYLQDNMF